MKKCDIIIPVWNELESTEICVGKLEEYTDYPYRLIIVDNGSDEPTRKYLESLSGEFPEYLLIRNSENVGFVKAVNQGIVASSNPYIVLHNNDAYVRKDWLSSLVETVEAGPANIGIANPTSNVFDIKEPDGIKGEWQELDTARGFSMLIKRELVERIGLFDETYKVGYFEEKDFCKRAIEAGFICVRVKTSYVYHRDRLTFDKLEDRDGIFKHNEMIYNKRWGRSLGIAFVAKENKELEERKELLYRLLSKGHRVFVFFSGKEPLTNLKDHIQLRHFSMPDFLFGYNVLFKLWKRSGKKRIELVIAADKRSENFFNRFRFISKAYALGEEREIIDFCESKSKGV